MKYQNHKQKKFIINNAWFINPSTDYPPTGFLDLVEKQTHDHMSKLLPKVSECFDSYFEKNIIHHGDS